jgi:hypothetical protein
MSDVIQEAQKLYKDAIDATREQRLQVEEDLAFSDPSDPQQWDDMLKRIRELDPGGSRPCLVMDRTGQYIDNISGTVSKSPPSIHVVPVDSKADKQVAEKLDGILRHVEYSSRASMHYTTALRSAARAGVGYLIIRPTEINYELNYQEPRIASEPDPLNVVFDPWCTELDGNNANFGYLLSEISHKEFESRFGSKEKKSFTDVERLKNDDRRDSIVIAEEWKAEVKKVNMIVFTNLRGEEETLCVDDYWEETKKVGITFDVLRTYWSKERAIHWRQMSGAEILEESKYPADQIGIVPVYGYVGYKDGVMKYCGVARRARNPQRAYNYHQSELLAYMSSAPKSPWLASTRAIKGLEPLWDRAGLDSRAYLPFNDLDEEGAVSQPSRMSVAVNLQNHMAGAEQALRDLEASIGMYQANLGAPSNETSRVAIDGRKESGETSVSHFPSNLSASIAQVGKICIQMIPKLMDTKRQQRVLGFDATSSYVTIDPEQQTPVEEIEQGISINPSIGVYDARVVIGASYTTQRSQTQVALAEVMRTNPELTPAIAPVWAMSLDVPNAEKLSQVLTAMAPPQVQEIMNPDANGKPKTEELIAKTQQLEQQLQQATDLIKRAGEELQQKTLALEEKESKIEIERYNAETNRLKITGANEEQIQTIVASMVDGALNQAHEQMMQEKALGEDMHDQTEPMEVEQQEEEPQQPSPDVLAMLEVFTQQTTAQAQAQMEMANAIAELADSVSKPRKKIPVRDKHGNITHVIETEATIQ